MFWLSTLKNVFQRRSSEVFKPDGPVSRTIQKYMLHCQYSVTAMWQPSNNNSMSLWTKKTWSQATGKGTYCFRCLKNYYSPQIIVSSLRQRIQKAPVNTVWLFHYNIEQSLSRSDWLAASRLNAVQVSFCQLIMLKHVPSDRLCIDSRWQFRIELMKHTCVIWSICKHTTLSVLSYKHVNEATDHRLCVLPAVMINMTIFHILDTITTKLDRYFTKLSFFADRDKDFILQVVNVSVFGTDVL